MNKQAIIIGSTGLVGSYLLNLLLSDGYYQNVISIVRKATGIQNNKLKEIVCDFENPDTIEPQLQGNDLFICIGTTIKVAGTKEKFFKVDHDYPLHITKMAKNKGLERVFLVSSVGADSKSRNFYLSVKGKLEEDIASLGLDCFISFRPSLLLGARKEFRLGESVAQKIMSFFDFLFIGPLANYKAIQAQKVAEAIIYWAKKEYKGFKVVSSAEMLCISAE